MSHHHRIYKCLITGLIALLVISTGIGASPRGSHGPALYYYNPDSLQSNLSRLKRDMDSFLSRSDYPMKFQPFARLSDFEKQLKDRRPAFLFIPHWYFKKYGDKLALTPLLTPVRKGAASYRKILLNNRKGAVEPRELRYSSLAMTSMGPEGDTILNDILFSDRGMDAGELNTIIVPKDSDALFALALGQVDMALVVKENMDLISILNPSILKSLNIVYKSTPIPMPVLCYSKGAASPSDVKKLKDLFLGGRKSVERVKVMEMLQIDEWQTVSY